MRTALDVFASHSVLFSDQVVSTIIVGGDEIDFVSAGAGRY